MRRYYLYGISGVYNYGCEAMIRSITASIIQMDPDAEVHYVSYSYDKDLKSLSDCEGLTIESVRNMNFSFVDKCVRFVKRKTRFASPQDRMWIDLEWTKDCDVLVIIGGDVFEIPSSAKTNDEYKNDRIIVSEAVKSHGGKVILWGISFGNFDSTPLAKAKIIDYLKNTVDIGIIRDKNSIDYLKANNITNVQLCSDPAFMQRTIQSANPANVVGINLSPLSNRYLKEKHSIDEWISIWSSFIKSIYEITDADCIYLIPHVVNSDNTQDDDYSYLELISRKLADYDVNNKLVPGNIGFLGVKKYIVQCKMVFAARMHCCVNAVTCGVPTVFLSYSSKSVGMCKLVYNDTDMLLDMNEMLTTNYDSSVYRQYESIDKIRNLLAKRNVELEIDARRAIDYVCKAIENSYD